MPQPTLDVRNLQTHFFTRDGVAKAVEDVSFSLGSGEVLGLVGESGSGKTVTGFSILGLVDPPGEVVGGEILFKGKDLLKLSEEEMRNVRGNHLAMVFQDPMMTLNPVLRIDTQMIEAIQAHQKVGTDVARERARDALGKVGIASPDERLRAYPHQLSGGQRQRVALARAIVREPTVFLMDEPLSNLDAKLRVSTRAQIKNLQHNLKVTTIYVTHDQVEAMTLADRVVVMNDGIVQQVGTPQEIYNKPANSFVASFIGSPAMNLLKGSISDGVFTSEGVKIGGLNNKHKGNVTLGFRAEDAVIVKSKGDISAPAFSMELLGDMTMVSVKSGGDLISIKSDKNYHADIGSNVMANISPNLCLLFDSENGQMLENL